MDGVNGRVGANVTGSGTNSTREREGRDAPAEGTAGRVVATAIDLLLNKHNKGLVA